MKQAEIPYCIHYPMPLHKQPCFSKGNEQLCPNAEWASKHVVSLPVCAFTDVIGIIDKLIPNFQ